MFGSIKTKPQKEESGYYKCPKWLNRLEILSSEAKDVYLFLEDLGKQYKAVFPTHKRIAFEIGKPNASKNTIKSYLEELYKVAFITRNIDPKTNWVDYKVENVADAKKLVLEYIKVWKEDDQKTDSPPINLLTPPYQFIDTPPIKKLTGINKEQIKQEIKEERGIKKEVAERDQKAAAAPEKIENHKPLVQIEMKSEMATVAEEIRDLINFAGLNEDSMLGNQVFNAIFNFIPKEKQMGYIRFIRDVKTKEKSFEKNKINPAAYKNWWFNDFLVWEEENKGLAAKQEKKRQEEAQKEKERAGKTKISHFDYVQSISFMEEDEKAEFMQKFYF